MRKGMTRLMAVWMSMLIIMLPFYISSAFATDSSTINVLSIKGADSIKGIRRSSGDYTKVDVEVFSSTPLTAQNLQLKSTAPSSTPVPFQTCTDISPYICTWQSQPNNLPAGAYSYYACIGNCNSCMQSSCKKTATIYVDGVAPTVDLLTSDKDMTNGGKLKLHYKITERACLAAMCTGKCSGISKAELYDVAEDNTKKLVGAINLNTDSCSVEDDYEFTSSLMANGERRLCMIAYDRFMQNSSINLGAGCIPIRKDSQLPSYSTVRLMDPAESYDLIYVADAGTSARLVANVSASALFKLLDRSLSADLSQIGGSRTDKIPCNDLGNGQWACSKLLNAKSSGSSTVQISAVDDGGNNNTQTFSFGLTVDSTAPVVDSITTGHEISKAPYLKGGLNYVCAVITEAGSGLAANNVYFGVGESEKAYCSSSGGKWSCCANITASGSSMLVNVHGYDNAGNSFSSAKNMLVDTINPALQKVVIRNANNNPYFVTNDDLLVKAYVSDDRAIVGDSGDYEVYLTPQGFADPNPVKAGSCAKDESSGAWLCQWTIMNLAPGKMSMLFNVSDFVGNTIEAKKSKFYIEYLEPATGNYSTLPEGLAEVYEVEGQAADYWTSQAETPMPPSVDSSTTELIEHSVWIPVQLTARSSATLFSVELSGCTGNDFGSYAKEAVLVRPSPKSDRPFVRVTLKRGAITSTQLNFECALNIISKHKNKISEVEVEGFNATVPVVAHGEVSQQVMMELVRVSRGWLVKAHWISSIGKVMDIFTKICELLYSIGRVIRDVTLLLHIKATICEKNPFCYPAAQSAKLTVSGLKKWEGGFWQISFKFCAYVMCDKTIYGKYTLDALEKGMGPVTDWMNKYIGLKKFTAKQQNTSEKRSSIEEKKRKGLQETGLFGDIEAWGNPRNSIILSIATGCIPGIFLNLQKARQIECQYLSCLVNDVPAGMPLVACTKVRNFQWCMFVWGEIFQIIPFIGSIKAILSPIINMLRDPLSLIFGIIGLACDRWPTAGESTFCHALNSVNSVVNMIKVLREIAEAKDIFNLAGTDSCKEALTKAESIISGQMPGQAGAAAAELGTGPT